MELIIIIREAQDNRIAVILPYNLQYISKIKKIKGHLWHPKEKYWSFPLNEIVLDNLLTIFENENIVMDHNLILKCGVLDKLKEELITRKYSVNTVKSYILYNENLIIFTKKLPRHIQKKDIKKYLYNLVEEKKSLHRH